MIRVLHSVGYMHKAGVETMLMNYYRHMDRSRFQFDFLCHKSDYGEYDDEIRLLGGRMFYAPPLGNELTSEYTAFLKTLLLKEPEIRIIHAHNGARQFFPLQVAKKSLLPIRISHAHGTDFVHNSQYEWKRELIDHIPNEANAFFACGNEAGRFFYGDRLWNECGVVINNGIELERFSYCSETRERIRSEYHISGCHVIGSIGRFEVQKNHSRLINIFYDIVQKDPLAVLVLIGTGKLESRIMNKAVELGVKDRVLFLGSRSDVQDWYQAMDVFIMPSFFEGLPLTGIEAQAAGLPCVFSDSVSEEVAITERVTFCPLSNSDDFWANVVLESLKYADSRTSGISALKAAGYDISDCALRLERIYSDLCSRA